MEDHRAVLGDHLWSRLGGALLNELLSSSPIAVVELSLGRETNHLLMLPAVADPAVIDVVHHQLVAGC